MDYEPVLHLFFECSSISPSHFIRVHSKSSGRTCLNKSISLLLSQICLVPSISVGSPVQSNCYDVGGGGGFPWPLRSALGSPQPKASTSCVAGRWVVALAQVSFSKINGKPKSPQALWGNQYLMFFLQPQPTPASTGSSFQSHGDVEQPELQEDAPTRWDAPLKAHSLPRPPRDSSAHLQGNKRCWWEAEEIYPWPGPPLHCSRRATSAYQAYSAVSHLLLLAPLELHSCHSSGFLGHRLPFCSHLFLLPKPSHGPFMPC